LSKWRVELTRAAQRDHRRLDAQVRGRIVNALEGLQAEQPSGDNAKLAGPDPEWRLRVAIGACASLATATGA
jgi:mRNA-degrading endonuclease RelE of RelBE toxin-antitoxin system